MSERAKIRRTAPATRRISRASSASGGAGRRAVAPVSRGFVARALQNVPIPAAQLRRAGNWLLGGLIVTALGVGLVAMQVPQIVGVALGEGIGQMGFAVRHVEILNRQQADRDVVYDIAMAQQSRAMPLVDLNGTRAELMKLGWIADARVSRRLPDTLVVDIVERKPAAIWQFQRRLALIDREGVVIAPVDDRAMPDLPIVIGPGANRRANEFAKLIDGAPQLKPLVTGATLLGDRRWDISFQSGETLSLPEGAKAAAKALAYFVSEDSRVGLLGKGFVRFDLRDPTRLVVRVSREPGDKVPDPATLLESKSVT